MSKSLIHTVGHGSEVVSDYISIKVTVSLISRVARISVERDSGYASHEQLEPSNCHEQLEPSNCHDQLLLLTAVAF